MWETGGLPRKDDGKSAGKCGHDPLRDEEREKPWLEKNSKAHKALQKIVLSKRFLNTFPYFTNFRYVGYKLRNQLAVIDFNSHRNRQPCKNAAGEIVHRGQYSKHTKQWRPVTVLQPKDYGYIPTLIVKIFEEQLKTGNVNRKIVRGADDPRNIAANIAVMPRPSIEHLVQVHKSRF
ncbi:Hypothetical predicted protein [Paramuricea clavata]|uniref:Uncharacterized protein n=1 Tax=Paramuricea clavata TaxID=317549 RepID=A0A6S7GK42_PARCT|nr:Hypothetical predicted protein [Paramuricea clavata]